MKKIDLKWFNKKRILIILGVSLGIILLSFLIQIFPESILGLLTAIAITIILKKVMDYKVERGSIKLHVRKSEPTKPTEPKPNRIPIPSVEREGDGVIKGSSESKVSNEYARQDKVQNTTDESVIKSDEFGQPDEPEREFRDNESEPGEDSKTSESSSNTTPDIQRVEEI